MDWQVWATITIIVAAAVLLASERMRMDLVALLVLAGLVVFGLITPRDALTVHCLRC